MALDELRDTDNVYEFGGYQYVVDKDFMDKASPIKVDFMGVGFQITSNIELQPACGSCASKSSSCG